MQRSRGPFWLVVAALLGVGETAKPSSTSSTKHIPSYSTMQNVTSSSNHDVVILGQSAASDHPSEDTLNSKKSPTTIKVQPEKKRKPAVSGTASASLRRIKKEYKDVVQMGICYDWVKGRLITSSTTNRDSTDVKVIVLGPLATNLRHWHFSFRGVKNSLYESGIYHGRILLPKDYPKSPPRVQLMTPSGRFKPFADICLSASAFHPESWTPQWTVLSLVHGLRLHMLTNPQEIGGVVSSADDTLEHARRSLAWRFAWIVGATKIVVDHATLMEQGALAIDFDHNEPGIKEPLKELHSESTLTSRGRVQEGSGEGTSVKQIMAIDTDTCPRSFSSDENIAIREIRRSDKDSRGNEKNEKNRRRKPSHSMTPPIVETQSRIGNSEWVGRITVMVSKALATPVARSLLFLAVIWMFSKQ